MGQQEAKRGLDLEPSSPVVLFAGNLAYDAGADILLDAIVTVCCSGDREALFLFAGEGAMRCELQGRASRAGLERRCRFLGDVPASDFNRVLRACDFVVIPGRVPQGEDLARMAVANGKPVLTTHQAATGGVIVHGRNGLITYDNPGSLVWGIRELLGPVYANLRRDVSAAA
jgi:glycosyltransferase involved in cell wall biosynthesis